MAVNRHLAVGALESWRVTRLKRRLIVWCLGAALLLVLILASTVGAVPLPFAELFHALVGDGDFQEGEDVLATYWSIWFSLRLPRLLLAAVIGMVLAGSGVVMQSLFQNPLGDPALLGVSGGAAMGTVLVLALGWHLGGGLSFMVLPFAAFVGGLLAVLLVYMVARRVGRTDMASLLLGGVALNALTAAVTGVFIVRSTDPELRGFMFWMLGGLDDADWFRLGVVSLFAFPALAVILAASKELDAFALGERNALWLGLAVERWRLALVIAVSVAVGISVAFCGIIGFVGLLAPHLVRALIGASHATLLPGALFLGAIILVLADLVARTAFLPGEAPVGVMTAFLGVPFFLFLLLANRQRDFA